MQKKYPPPDPEFSEYTFPRTGRQVYNCLQPTTETTRWAQLWQAAVREYVQHLKRMCKSEEELSRLHGYLRIERLLGSLAHGEPGSSEHDYIQGREWLNIKHLVIASDLHVRGGAAPGRAIEGGI